MKTSAKVITCVLATALSLGVAGCAGKTATKNVDFSQFENYKNPDSVETTAEKYVVHVQSEGGLKLDGVRVTAYRNDTAVRTSISNEEGVIELAVSLDEYRLVVDESSLPAGYYMRGDGTEYKTNPTRRDEVTIKVASRLVEKPASSYRLGQVMSDFTFTDCAGAKHKLSTTLENKKCVVINFFYTACNPCKAEFPAVQKAYENFRDDVEVFAVSTVNNNDDNSSVSKFKSSNGLTFPMGIDDIGLTSGFGATRFPTTVIIDRYGLIAYKTTGGEPSETFWRGLFNRFTSDSYVQNVSSSENDEDISGGNEMVTPTVEMSPDKEMQAAANGEGVNATYHTDDDFYAWPWLASTSGNDSYIYTSNKGISNSYSTVHVKVPMKADDVLSFEYNVSSEKDKDNLYAFVDGQIMNANGWSATDGWQTANVYVADTEKVVDLALLFQKDSADVAGTVGEDTAMVRNIHLLKSGDIQTPMDVMRPAVSGLNKETMTYDNYIEVVYNPDDGYFHKKDGSGSILYISLIQTTAWTQLHMDSTTTLLSDGTYYYNSLFDMTDHLYREGSGYSTKYVLFDENGLSDDGRFTEEINRAYDIQMFMEEPYKLIPVTMEMHDWMVSFVRRHAAENGRETYDNEWLEFCYYFDHYGAPDEKSFVSFDRTRGMRAGNALIAYAKGDEALASYEFKGVTEGSNRAIVEYAKQTYRGTYYKFTAPEKGVYKVRSYTHNYKKLGEEPRRDENGEIVYDDNGNAIMDPIYEEDDGTFASSAEAVTSMYLSNAQGKYLTEYNYVLDFEYLTTPGIYSAFDFSSYLELEANETVYMIMCLSYGETGYFDFTIEYVGESAKVMSVCVLDGGLWESLGRVNTIECQYHADTDRYYALNDAGLDLENGKIYIDFTHPNNMMYGALQNMPLETYINNGRFEIYSAPETSEISNAQTIMENYLAEAKTNGGLVEANYELVEILKQLVDDVCEGGGEGNGWLMFAVYEHVYGER